MKSPALRFPVAVVGVWICLRTAVLAPGWWGVRPGPPDVQARSTAAPAIASAPTDRSIFRPEPTAASSPAPPPVGRGSRKGWTLPPMPAAPLERPAPQRPDGQPVTIAEALQDAPAPLAPAGAVAMKRWSAFAWLLVRGDAPGTALAPGGTLGGSQAGGFVRFRLGDGLSLGARASTALRPPRGAEIAVGLDWRPDRSIPINLLAERRQRLGAGGRSAFAITLYGGATRALPGRLRLDGYAQGGIVGLKSRDLFVDGSARLSAPLGPVEIALGGWGAAQPGAARLDAGPSLSYRLPVRGGNLRLQGDWRFRLAGDAVPGSGVALTLAADF